MEPSPPNNYSIPKQNKLNQSDPNFASKSKPTVSSFQPTTRRQGSPDGLHHTPASEHRQHRPPAPRAALPAPARPSLRIPLPGVGRRRRALQRPLQTRQQLPHRKTMHRPLRSSRFPHPVPRQRYRGRRPPLLASGSPTRRHQDHGRCECDL